MLPEKYCNLSFDKSIEIWDEGIPLGNGKTGALIWGKANALRFSIDKNGLWDCSGYPEKNRNYTYRSMKRYVKFHRQDRIYSVFDKPYYKPTPTKLPVGKIIIDLKTDDNIESYLDLSNAQATLTIGSTKIKTFLDATDDMGHILISNESCDLKIDIPKFSSDKKYTLSTGITQALSNLKYPKSQHFNEQIGDIYIEYFKQEKGDGEIFGLMMVYQRNNGETHAVYAPYIGEDNIDTLKHKLVKVIGDSYDAHFKNHSKWWERYWKSSDIKLPNKQFEQQWYLGNYLLASCSRKGSFPMPLQGVWTADNDELPPWKGDYHHDLNTQLSYQSYLKSNHIDEGEVFFDFIFSLQGQFRKFTKSFYKTDGNCMPSVMDIKGHALGGWPMYSLSPTNQAWICYMMYRHYCYTRDDNYLKEKIYPFVREYCDFLLKIMKTNKSGKYVLPLSSSPEMFDNTQKSWLEPNSTYDLSLLRAVYYSASKMAHKLGKADDCKKWNDILSHLDILPTNEDGVFMIDKNFKKEESHRHFSHMMAIHPLNMLDYTKARDKKIIDACILDEEKYGTDLYCGYSYAWLANIYCIQRNGKKAYDTLNIFWNYFCLPNGFHCNGDYKDGGYSSMKYRPFTLEGNFCAVEALQNMLLYSENEKIILFPAIPDNWNDISFTLRAEGDIIVKATLKSKTVKATFTSNGERKFKLELNNSTVREITVTENQPFNIEYTL